MRPIVIGLVVLLFAMSATSAMASAPRTWEVQLTAGLSGAGETRPGGGRCWALGIAKPVRRALSVGAGLEWHEFEASRGSTDFEEPYLYERSRLLAAVATARLQMPAPTGLLPFALAEGGAGHLRLGDLRWTLNSPRTVPGRAGLVWIAGAGVGLRLALPAGWPALEASLRGGAWSSPVPMFEYTHRATYGKALFTAAW